MGLFCQDCGNEIASQYKFCPACGSRNLAQGMPSFQATAPAQVIKQVANPSSASIQNWQNQGNALPTSAGVMMGRMTYAGFWRRLFAYLLDLLLVTAVFFVIGLIIGIVAPNISESIVEAVFNIVGVLAMWIYFANSESGSHQATFGKRALGLKVCDEYGNRLTFGRASGRFFGKFLSGLIVGIGFLMVAFTQKKQGLHDLMAKALVIRTGE